jgi:hypothetical protein
MSRISKSYALQIVFSFFEEPEQVCLQRLNRRFYREIIPAQVPHITLYKVGSLCSGVMLFANESSIHLLDPKVDLSAWYKTDIHGEFDLNYKFYGNSADKRNPYNGKLCQVDGRYVYLLGGMTSAHEL